MSSKACQRAMLMVALALGLCGSYAGSTEDLVAALAKSKISLADGVGQVAKGGSVPLSAKFEFDDSGKLSLSVYAAEREHATPATNEGRALVEMSGSPEHSEWKPEIEVFKDVEHVARSSQQLALMSIAHITLLAVIARAHKHQPGTIFSITPEVRERTPVAVVLVANKGEVTELVYNLANGALFQASHP